MKKKIDKFIHSRFFIIILICVLIVITTLVGTFAWFTWSNPTDQNTIFTMSIGEIIDITFTNGNTIDGKLDPVYNYTDGLSTSFIANNKSIEDVKYKLLFNVTSIDSELTSSDNVKYVVLIENEIVSEGNLKDVTNGESVTLSSGSLPSGVNNFVVYFYIDGNVYNDSNMMNKSISGNIMMEVIENYTPLSDFEYFFPAKSGFDSDIVYISAIDKFIEYNAYYFSENEVVLTEYVGQSADVIVPNTYYLDGVTYNVVLLTGHQCEAIYDCDDFDYCQIVDSETFSYGVFLNNTNIKTVNLGSAVRIVYNEYSFDTGTITHDDDALWLFDGCINLLTVSEIPSSVMFLNYTFNGCTSLVNVPEIPSSVYDMNYTFNGCTSLVNVPEIPSSVSYMNYIFKGCTSLSGVVKINNANLLGTTGIFDGTVNDIVVEVPDGSATFERFSGVDAFPSNVTVRTF